MTTVTATKNHVLPKRLGWWVLFTVCLVYAFYAFGMAFVEIWAQLGLTQDAPHRSVPPVFLVHALAGGLALISGALQFNRDLLRRRRARHRLLGRIYVGTIWLSSLAGLWLVLFFDVTPAARVVLGVLAVLWFATTTVAFSRIRQRRIDEHREWMIRSFSLSFFFVTFSLWVPGLAGTSLPEAVSYPLAVFLSWSLNLAAAEAWIRHTRKSVQDYLGKGATHDSIE